MRSLDRHPHGLLCGSAHGSIITTFPLSSQSRRVWTQSRRPRPLRSLGRSSLWIDSSATTAGKGKAGEAFRATRLSPYLIRIPWGMSLKGLRWVWPIKRRRTVPLPPSGREGSIQPLIFKLLDNGAPVPGRGSAGGRGDGGEGRGRKSLLLLSSLIPCRRTSRRTKPR